MCQVWQVSHRGVYVENFSVHRELSLLLTFTNVNSNKCGVEIKELQSNLEYFLIWSNRVEIKKLYELSLELIFLSNKHDWVTTLVLQRNNTSFLRVFRKILLTLPCFNQTSHDHFYERSNISFYFIYFQRITLQSSADSQGALR